MATIINRSGTSAVVHITTSNSIVVAGNSTTSNIASNNEDITGGAIAQVWWGAANSGFWTVKRGSTPLLTLTDTGYMDYAGCGASLIANSSATIDCTLVGTTNGYIMIEIQKIPQSTGYTQ